MDLKLREIISKQAGVYFFVTSKQAVAEVEETSKMRLFFINTEQSPVNSLVKFAKGDSDAFTSVFGKSSRIKEKGGNFSHQTCLDALKLGPIAVVNLRSFNDLRDVCNVGTINPNTILVNGIKNDKVPYESLFNTSSFWIPKTDNVSKHYESDGFLNFANIGSSDFSVIVVKATDAEVALMTSEGKKTLDASELEIDELGGLNFETLVKDTFVTVYLFNKVLSQNNPAYSHLFTDGKISYGNISTLTQIASAGFYKKYTGSVIPNLVSEKNTDLSIDKVVYADFLFSGMVVDINEDLLEATLDSLEKDNGMIDLLAFDGYKLGDEPGTVLSYNVPTKLANATAIKYLPTTRDENRVPSVGELQTEIVYETEEISQISFKSTATQGIKVGDYIKGITNNVVVESMNLLTSDISNKTYSMDHSYVGLIYGNGKYLGVSNTKDDSGKYFRWSQSVDKTTWTSLDINISDLGLSEDVVFNHAIYGSTHVVFGYDSVTSKNTMLMLESGVWKNYLIDVSEQINKVAYGNGKFVCLTDTKIVVIGGKTTVVYDNVDSLIDICYNTSNSASSFFGISLTKVVKSNTGLSGSWTTVKTNETPLVISYKHITSTDSNVVVFIETIADSEFKGFIKSANDGVDWTAVTLSAALTALDKVVSVGTKTYLYTNNVLKSLTDLAAAVTTIDLSGESYTEFVVTKSGTELSIVGSDGTTDNATFIGTTTATVSMSEQYVLTVDIYEVTCNGGVDFTTVGETKHISKIVPFAYNPNVMCNVFTFESYVPVSDQFTNGTSQRQSEILDMMNNPSIVKGVKSVAGIRYIVDCFKSFVEPNYKSQYGLLVDSLNTGNKFVAAILAEPSVEDLRNSSNPLFKNFPGGKFDVSYLETGGNQDYSTIFLTKFVTGADHCYWFGPENVIKNVPKSVTGIVSNLFYTKANPFDIIANTTGYVTVTELSYKFEDEERKFLEAFGYNPIIDFGGNTIFGNNTGRKTNDSLRQIHNSELLLFIKETLYNIGKKESFKKGTYDDYLRTQTETTDFMDSLAMVNAIKANPIVQCDLVNNTDELQKSRIKLIHVEYTAIDGLEKIVFDINLN